MEQSKKFFPLLLCSVLFTLTLSFVCFAGSWKQDAKGYWYQNDDGSYPKIPGNGLMRMAITLPTATTLMRRVIAY